MSKVRYENSLSFSIRNVTIKKNPLRSFSSDGMLKKDDADDVSKQFI